MNSRKKKLVEIMGEGNVYDDPETLKRYSRDESFSLPMRPSFVVKPGDAAKVEEVIHWANRTRTPLIPVSSGPPRFRCDTVPGAPESVVVVILPDPGRVGFPKKVGTKAPINAPA